MILDPQNFDPNLVEKFCSNAVKMPGDVTLMNLSVQFHGEAFGRAVQIEYVIADAMLTAELSTVKFRTLEIFP